MNAFVRDGAVNRKRRVRHRSIGPNRKKICKTEYDDRTTTQSDLQLNFGESAVNQSTSVAIETEKESRYSNADFIRAKAFLYLKFKKLNPANVNKVLKEHLKRFDKDGTQLKKIFEQCYDLTKGSVEMSEAMMKQLETNSCVRLTNESFRISDELFNNSCKEVVEKTVKRNNITKDKKIMPLCLKKRIDDKISILFGNFHSKSDKKILYSNTTFHTVPENDNSHKICRITKSYSIRTTQNDSFRETKISKPNANCIVRENNISCINNPVNGIRKIKISQLKIDGIVQNAKESVSETNVVVEKCITPLLKIDVAVQNTRSSALEILHNVEEIMIPHINMDEIDHNAKELALKTNIETGEIVVPQLRNDETIQNTKELALETVDDDDVREIMFPRLIIDKTVESNKKSEFKTAENITVPQLNMNKRVNNVKDSALEIASDGGEIMIPWLIVDETVESNKESVFKTAENITVPQLNMNKRVNNVKDSALEIASDGGEIMIPRLIVDETVESNKESEFKTAEKITVPQLNMNKRVNNVKDSALEIASDGGEIMIPRLIVDETVESNKESEFKTAEKITVPQLNMNKRVNNVKDSALEIASDGGEIMIPRLIVDETVESNKESESKTAEKITVPQLNMNKRVNNVKDSALEIASDGGEIMISQLRMDGNIENTKSSPLKTNIDVINEIENRNDMNQQPETLKHFINVVLKIGRLIDPEDEIFKISIIKDLATYFLNDDFLSKVDTLFNTTESDLIGELIVNLLVMFNDSQCNMAQFSGCLISVFREIALQSSIPPYEMKLKLIVFLDAVKRYIKVHDYGLYTSWFLPSMFFDWCFFVAYIFMNTNKDFVIDLHKKSIIKNATLYYNMVKQSKYLFINQDCKPKKTLRKSGIFELTRIDDLLEIDNVHTKKSNNQVILNNSINIPFKEHKHDKNENENCIETINFTTMAEDEEKECPAPINCKIYVNPKYNISNSFIEPLNWFNFNVTELGNKLNATISNKRDESSIVVQNNTTNVDNNIQPIASNLGSEVTSVKNKPRKRKKSTQVESPRVYFTVANNPKQFNLTYGSLVVPQNSSSSTDPQNTSSSKVSRSSILSTNPQNTSLLAIPQSSRSSKVPRSSSLSKVPRKSSLSKVPRKSSSSTIPQNESLLTIPRNPYSSTVSQNSSSLTFPQYSSSSAVSQNSSSLTFPQYSSSSAVSTNRSSYYNNILSNTQYPQTLQTVIPQSPYSSTVPQNLSSLTFPQCPRSSGVSQNSSSLTFPQYSSSSTVSTNRSSYYNNILSNTQYPQTLQTVIPQSPYSSTVPQNSSSLTFLQHPRSSAVSQNASLLTIPQNPYSPTVHQNLNSLTIPQHSSSSSVSQHLSPYYNNFSSNHTQIPIGFRNDSSISDTTQTSNSKSTPLSVNNNLQSSITTLPPVSSNKWPPNLYHQSTATNTLCSMVANTCSSNVPNISNFNKNPYFRNACCHYTSNTGFSQSDMQSLYKENILFTTSQISNALTCTTNRVDPISRDVVGNTQTSVASINNAYIQKLNDKYNNFNYGSSLVNQNNLRTPEYNPQVSPDLPDARLPNMPNIQDSEIKRKKTCMAANCSNISCFRCESCMSAVYCSIQCQTTDLHYHKNECQRF